MSFAWWLGLHALLLGAAVLVGWPWWCSVLAMLGIVGHAVLRRPAPPPGVLLVASDGLCRVPELDPRWLPPGPRTRLAVYWVSLSIGEGRSRRDIVLWVDQLDAASWAQLCARLLRRGVAGTIPIDVAQSTDRTDLR